MPGFPSLPQQQERDKLVTFCFHGFCSEADSGFLNSTFGLTPILRDGISASVVAPLSAQVKALRPQVLTGARVGGSTMPPTHHTHQQAGYYSCCDAVRLPSNTLRTPRWVSSPSLRPTRPPALCLRSATLAAAARVAYDTTFRELVQCYGTTLALPRTHNDATFGSGSCSRITPTPQPCVPSVSSCASLRPPWHTVPPRRHRRTATSRPPPSAYFLPTMSSMHGQSA